MNTRNRPVDFRSMSYVDLMAWLGEVNRPPGGKASVREIALNCFLRPDSRVLDVGCNTGYCSFEIAHLVGCYVLGVDLSPTMIRAAKKVRRSDSLQSLITFRVADGQHLPLKDSSFDLVMSGGSTAFIDDKDLALREYARVVRPWGFVADINFYYHTTPPVSVLKNLNRLLGTGIQPWNEAYWLALYESVGLELYYKSSHRAHHVSRSAVQQYCQTMAEHRRIDPASQRSLESRLYKIMSLFNDNHRYLSYGVFILRRRPSPEQVSLFGK